MTCAHVVQHASKVMARLVDGREYETEILKVDRGQDLAILKMKGLEGQKVPYLPIGNSEALKVGDKVLAIGNSFGLGQAVTSGIVSALSRLFNGKLLIQTDAAVNPGNSGGALVSWSFNSDHQALPELIGVPNAILSRSGASHGVNFAIPASLVAKMIKRLDPNYFEPWVGIYTQTLTPELITNLKERGFKGIRGVIVTGMHSQSPAQTSGLLKAGDVILFVNDKPVTCEEGFEYAVSLSDLSQDLKMQVWSQGQDKNVSVPVIKAPADPKPQKVELDVPFLKGVVVANLSPALAREYHLDEKKTGVVVIETPEQSPSIFMNFRLEVGDHIVAINRQTIQSVEELQSAFNQKERQIEITIERGGQQVSLIVRG